MKGIKPSAEINPPLGDKIESTKKADIEGVELRATSRRRGINSLDTAAELGVKLSLEK